MVAWLVDDRPAKEDARKARRRTRLRLVAKRPLERVRVDALPERTEYFDTGCEFAASCLRCPFARCQYDVPGGFGPVTRHQRDREIALLRCRHNAPIPLLARSYGVTRRHIHRILREHGVKGT